MPKLTKEQRADMLMKQQAIEIAAKAVASAALLNGVGVTDIIDLIRAKAFYEVKQSKFQTTLNRLYEKDQN